MANYNESDGVWRTIGGRRVFIKSGQSMSDAMKKSGKFSKKKQSEVAKEEKEKWNKQLEHDKAIANDESQSKEMREFAARRAEESQKEADRFQKYEERFAEKEKTLADVQSYTDKQIEEGRNPLFNKKQQGVQNLKDKLNGSKEEDEVATVRSQMSELEEASGSKVKDAFQTDLFGNGKENRFILEDGTIVGHTLESFGEKTDDWYVGDRHFKNYDEVKSYLSGGSKKGGDEFEDVSKELREISSRTGGSSLFSEAGKRWNELYKKDKNNVGRDLDDGYRMSVGYDGTVSISSSHPYDDTDYAYAVKRDNKWEVRNPLSKSKTTFSTRDEALKEMKKIDDHIRSGEKTMDYEGITRYKAPSQNSAYKNAFEEYKKKHPNTKLTLQKFINMSEGK